MEKLLGNDAYYGLERLNTFTWEINEEKHKAGG